MKKMINSIRFFLLFLFVFWGLIQTSFAQYTLADDDVAVTNGVIISCSYDFEIKDIIIPDVLDGQSIVGISRSIFYSKGISSVQLPSTLKTISKFAFSSNNLSSLTIPTSVTFIGEEAFSGNKLSDVTIPNSVTQIGGGAFNNNQIVEINGTVSNGIIYARNQDGTEDNTIIVSYGGSATVIDFIPNSVVSIENLAFYGNGLTSVIIPASVNYIRNDAFSNNGLTSISIPNSVTYIGDGAFRNNGLTGLSIPDGVSYIGNGAFRNNNITSLVIPGSVTHIGTAAFLNNQITEYNGLASNGIIYARNTNGTEDNSTIISYGGSADVIDFIPSTVTSIGELAFAFSELTGVTLPGSVTNIGKEAFAYNKLTALLIPNSVTSVAYGAFSNNSLSNVTISNSIESIEEQTFFSNSLTSVEIPGTVKTIGKEAFKSNNLSSVIISNGVVSIGDEAFYENGLVSLTIPSSLTNIGNKVFYNNSLTGITIPNSVKQIGNWAFYSNNLSSVIFEANSSIAYMGIYAFDDNAGLASVTLPTHSHPDFVEYTDEEGNTYNAGDEISDFKLFYYADIPYTITDADVVVVNGIIESCSYDFSFKNIIIPDTLDGQKVTDIKQHFAAKEMISLKLPSTLQSIGGNALIGNELNGLSIPGSVISVGAGAFKGNRIEEQHANFARNLTFEANSNIASIGANIFYNFFGHISVKLPTHASPNFIEYRDENGKVYNEGDSITDFSLAYYAVIDPYTVTFNNWDGTVLKTELVEHGDNAIAPADPTRQDYVFKGWDIDFTKVISDLTITANYGLATGVADEERMVLNIYPNPASDYISVVSSDSGIESIQFIAITGKLVRIVRPDTQNIRLDISNLNSGMYFVKVKTSRVDKVFKLIKR